MLYFYIVWMLPAPSCGARLIESSREKGVQQVRFPFETAGQSLLFAPDDGMAVLERPLGNGFSLRDLIGTAASHYLERAMREAGGVKVRAAKLLGFEQYQTLTSRLKKYRGK